MTLVRAVLLCWLFASAAQAQHFASDKRVEFRAGISLLWYATTNMFTVHGAESTVGALPIEPGIGFRPTPDTSVALLGRIGLIQYGASLELQRTLAEDWGHDGPVLRLAPTILRDLVPCIGLEQGSGCDAATNVMVEAGIAWRWAFRSTGGFSVGASLTAGSQHINYVTGKSSSRLLYGLMGPRFAFDF